MLIPDIVALVDNTSFEFSCRVGFRQLKILFDADLKDLAEVCLSLVFSDFADYVIVLSNLALIPTSLLPGLPEATPLHFEGSLRLRVAKAFFCGHVASNASVHRHVMQGYVFPVFSLSPRDGRHGRDHVDLYDRQA